MPAARTAARAPALGLLRGLLLTEAAAGLVVAIFLSMLAAGVQNASGSGETELRFAASGAFLVGLFAAIASRGVRRRRGWAWTMAAVLQVLIAVATGAAILLATWHPALLLGFALPVAVMLVLSAASVRSALGQS
jgi:hypothetical protein